MKWKATNFNGRTWVCWVSPSYATVKCRPWCIKDLPNYIELNSPGVVQNARNSSYILQQVGLRSHHHLHTHQKRNLQRCWQKVCHSPSGSRNQLGFPWTSHRCFWPSASLHRCSSEEMWRLLHQLASSKSTLWNSLRALPSSCWSGNPDLSSIVDPAIGPPRDYHDDLQADPLQNADPAWRTCSLSYWCNDVVCTWHRHFQSSWSPFLTSSTAPHASASWTSRWKR